MKSNKAQQGVSLIELMIAMTLGVILLVGVVQIFLGSRQTYGVVIGQSQVLDNGRLALHFMGEAIRKSGYWSDGWTRTYGSDTGLSAGGYTGVFAADSYIFGLNDDASDASVVDGTDEFYVRFNGDDVNVMSNCVGQSISASQVAIERYYVRPPAGTETLPSLMCEATVLDIDIASGSVSAPATPAMVTQPLISGIENMQVFYGERSLASGNNQFVSADGVSSWDMVESVRISLLAASADTTVTAGRTAGFTLLDVTTAVPTDNRSRKVFEQLVALRNPNLF